MADTLNSVPIILSHPHACSYLDNRTAQSAFIDPSFPMRPAIYAYLLEQGFRRSGDLIYSPRCAQCSACIPVRIPVSDFTPSRNQKRTLKKNRGTEVRIKPAVYDPKHYALYQRYQQTRHAESSMAHATPEEYINFLTSHWCDTLFAEFLIDGTLAAVAIVDQFSHAYSAVYTFFDPLFSYYSLGSYAILWQIHQARQTQRNWLYLGFWIKDCRKMAYKTQYRPIQGYINRQWQAVQSYE